MAAAATVSDELVMLPARVPSQDMHRRRQHSCGSAPYGSSAPYVERTYSYERDDLGGSRDKKQTLCGACGGAAMPWSSTCGRTPWKLNRGATRMRLT